MCMCTCVCACMCVLAYVQCMYMYMYVYVCVFVYVSIYTTYFLYTFTYMCMYVCMYVVWRAYHLLMDLRIMETQPSSFHDGGFLSKADNLLGVLLYAPLGESVYIYVCMNGSMYVCMYACIYICMYVCMYACMYVCNVVPVKRNSFDEDKNFEELNEQLASIKRDRKRNESTFFEFIHSLTYLLTYLLHHTRTHSLTHLLLLTLFRSHSLIHSFRND